MTQRLCSHRSRLGCLLITWARRFRESVSRPVYCRSRLPYSLTPVYWYLIAFCPVGRQGPTDAMQARNGKHRTKG